MLSAPTEGIFSIAEYEDQNSEQEKTEITASKMRSPKELFEGMDWSEKRDLKDKIWAKYAEAMKLRNREPLEQDRFEYHFFEGGNYEETVLFGGDKDGFLMGNSADGVFIPTHFAPATLRGGYRLIKGLLDEEIPTALFITKDLVDTIEKMDGYKIIPFKIKVDFHGEEVEKTLVVTSWNVLPKLAVGQAQRFVKSKFSNLQYKLRDTQYYLSEFGEKVKNLLAKDKSNADELSEELKISLEEQDNDMEDDIKDLLSESTLAKINTQKK